MPELRELALPRQHAVQIAVRGEEMDRLRGDEVALRRHERFTCGERIALAQRRGYVVPAAYAAKPIGKQAGDFRPQRTHAREETVAVSALSRPPRRPPRARRARFAVARPFASGLSATQGCATSSRRELDGVEPFAEHRLEGVLPPGLDVEPLPQTPGVGDAVIGEPLRAVLALADLRLQRGKRLRTRLDVGQLVSGSLRGIARPPVPVLQLLHRVAQRVQSGFLRRELGLLLAQLIVDRGDLDRHRRARRRKLALQALAARARAGARAPRRSRASSRSRVSPARRARSVVADRPTPPQPRRPPVLAPATRRRRPARRRRSSPAA